MQLLDDPLSAVDPRVGRVLFDRCISNTGLLAGATRLLVTHQRQFLSGCDSVIVLRDGSVAHRCVRRAAARTWGWGEGMGCRVGAACVLFTSSLLCWPGLVATA